MPPFACGSCTRPRGGAPFDVLLLTRLHPAAKQDNQRVSIATEVYPVAGARVNPELVDAVPDASEIR